VIILDSIKKALRGEEKLWVVFWLWGVLLYISSFAIGVFSAFLDYDYGAVKYLVGTLGLALVFVYPFIFIKSLWKCSANTSYVTMERFTKFFAVGFIFIHLFMSIFIFGGSTILLGLAK
jgi:hypothetical protein